MKSSCFSAHDSPIITILMPNLNKEPYLRSCLESLENQTLNKQLFQVYFLDGGSTDNSICIAREFEGILNIRISQQSSSGMYQAWNELLSLVQTPYLAYLTSDDIFGAYFLEAGLNALQTCSSADLLIYNCKIKSNERDGYCKSDLMTHLASMLTLNKVVTYRRCSLSVLNALLPGFYGSFHNMFIRTKLFTASKKLDPFPNVFPLDLGSHADSSVFGCLSASSDVIFRTHHTSNTFVESYGSSTSISRLSKSYLKDQFTASTKWCHGRYFLPLIYILSRPYYLYAGYRLKLPVRAADFFLLPAVIFLFILSLFVLSIFHPRQLFCALRNIVDSRFSISSLYLLFAVAFLQSTWSVRIDRHTV